MSETQTLELPEPPSANRWWRNVNGRMVTSKEARKYKENAAIFATIAKMRPLDGPVSLTVVWFRSRKSGDLDKRLGVLLDALQGTCYHSDAQITELHAHRSDADPEFPRVVITISPASP
jgi:crossover junction endodeoxyribonuclease RusA